MQQAINHIAAACAAAGIKHAIICPGSRNAPLTMAFARHPQITCHSVIDERSAGFIALGMAQQWNFPVALICTSGSAVVNFYPAVVEAFYQGIPLLVITADRPPELIDQWDGQTLHQNNIFGAHVKESFTTPDDYTNEQLFSDIVLNGFSVAVSGKKGPVHINVPLREPLYDGGKAEFFYPEIKYNPGNSINQSIFTEDFNAIFNNSENILIVNGAAPANNQLKNSLNRISALNKVVVLSDVVSNQHQSVNIANWDAVLIHKDERLKAQLRPQLLITTGTSVVAKNLKVFLRKYKPQYHFHIAENGDVADPFNTSPVLLKTNEAEFLNSLNFENKSNTYFSTWKNTENKIAGIIKSVGHENNFNEFTTTKIILDHLPENSMLQLANSMPVRYVNLLGIPAKNIQSYGNRGVSGIDGCVSTAVGAAFAVKNQWITLLTGDVAFFYDSNALWNKFAPANLRIVILNNGGGGIFRMIDGPAQLPELEQFFETVHNRNAELMAKDLGVGYRSAKNYEELERGLSTFYMHTGRPEILEIVTDRIMNTAYFNEFKSRIYGTEI